MFFQETHLFVTGGRSNFRIPSIVSDNSGSVYAFCNDRRDSVSDSASEVELVLARKRKDADWEPVRSLSAIPGWACGIGSAVYDGITDTVMCSARRNPVVQDEFTAYSPEEAADMARQAAEKSAALGIKPGDYLLFSKDGGNSWQERPLEIEPVEHTHWDGTVARISGACHGAAHGIQLQNGPHRGRLLCPSRTAIGSYHDWEGLRKCVYNNAIYSDDHGLTWKASTPVQLATGEGTLIERADGSILYNSRAYFRDQKRYLATSTDGGESYGDFRTDDFLLEEKYIGCNASFLRISREALENPALLPEKADGLTVFANPRAETRHNMTACISFDSGSTWAGTKTVFPGPSGYSSLCFNGETQRFFLLYEKGAEVYNDSGITVAEFDIEWLLSEL